jgi:N-formylglutamate deformylase
MGKINTSYELHKPEDILIPLVCDVPHAGRIFPDDFNSNIAENELRKWEDSYVDELSGHAPNYGSPLLTANIHRTYIDLNRHVMDIHPDLIQKGLAEIHLNPTEKTIRTGNGLLKRIGPNGETMHKKNLNAEDVQHRVKDFYVPYHKCLNELISDTKTRFGKVYHLNMHSMFSHSDFWVKGENGTERADFVLSNNNNATCEPSFTKFVKDTIENMGYSVALNDPFLGGEIVCVYGNPEENIHSLQIEIKKSLYMDQFTLEKHREFKRVHYDISKLLKAVAWWAGESIGK